MQERCRMQEYKGWVGFGVSQNLRSWERGERARHFQKCLARSEVTPIYRSILSESQQRGNKEGFGDGSEALAISRYSYATSKTKRNPITGLPSILRPTLQRGCVPISSGPTAL